MIWTRDLSLCSRKCALPLDKWAPIYGVFLHVYILLIETEINMQCSQGLLLKYLIQKYVVLGKHWHWIMFVHNIFNVFKSNWVNFKICIPHALLFSIPLTQEYKWIGKHLTYPIFFQTHRNICESKLIRVSGILVYRHYLYF